MLIISKLEEARADGDWVVVTPDGEVVDLEVPGTDGQAILMVTPVTDALKIRSGERVTGGLSRDEVWAVVAVALSRAVLQRLAGEMTYDELVEHVSQLGYGWQVCPL